MNPPELVLYRPPVNSPLCSLDYLCAPGNNHPNGPRREATIADKPQPTMASAAGGLAVAAAWPPTELPEAQPEELSRHAKDLCARTPGILKGGGRRYGSHESDCSQRSEGHFLSESKNPPKHHGRT